MDRSRLFKPGLLLAVVALLLVSSLSQSRLDEQRVALGLNRGEPLGATAPPVLVFTTVALGGFRGLIANALWIRTVELQEQDKFFEKVQLADWITKLQPHFTTVWAYQAWDMAYNISVKFDDPADRWKWVQRGIELLRDEALRYNPNEALIYQQLAWLFQHKLGQDLDDAHMFYKSAWASAMDDVLNGTNYVELIDPQTDDQKRRARILREQYKLDPARMRQVDEEYGPLEWRLPEAHAVYWALLGLERAQKDQITLRRTLYQPMQIAFRRGRLIKVETPDGPQFQFGPNLAMIPRANRAYERMMEQDPAWADHISRGHKHFLKDAVYFLYTHNRRAEAQRWMDYLLQKYPDVLVVDERQEGAPLIRVADLSLDEYAVARVTEVVGETSNERVRQVLEGLLVRAYYNFAIGEDDQGLGYQLLAQKVWARFQRQIAGQEQRIGLPSFDLLRQQAFTIFDQSYPEELTARLRSALGMGARTNVPPPAAPTPQP